MLKRHEIQALRRAKHTLLEVAELPGLSRSSVRRGAAGPEVTTLDAAGERARRGAGRPSKVEAFRGLPVGRLARQHDLLALNEVYVEDPEGALSFRSREGVHGRRAHRAGDHEHP